MTWKKDVLKFAFRVLGRCLRVGLFLMRLQANSLQPHWKRTFYVCFFNDFDCGFTWQHLVHFAERLFSRAPLVAASVYFSIFMIIQTYCIMFLKLKVQRLFQNLAERLKLQLFAKIVNSFKAVDTFL